MKKIYSIIILSLLATTFFSCKKENVTPQTVTIHDTVSTTKTIHDTISKTNTVTVTQHDTVTVMPFAEIIQGAWTIYKLNNTAVNQTFVCTSTTFNQNNNGNQAASYSSDFSIIYNSSGTAVYKLYHNEPSELKLYCIPFDYYFYIRR